MTLSLPHTNKFNVLQVLGESDIDLFGIIFLEATQRLVSKKRYSPHQATGTRHVMIFRKIECFSACSETMLIKLCVMSRLIGEISSKY